MKLNKRTIAQVDVKGKFVFMRVDFNVPLRDGQIADDRRIRLSLDSIRNVIGRGGRLILASHLGRPAGIGPERGLSLAPCAARLAELLPPTTNVKLAPDCVGDAVEDMVLEMDDGDVLLLENLRFHAEETKNDPAFARQLASVADLYVNDAFGTAHRREFALCGCPVAGWLACERHHPPVGH